MQSRVIIVGGGLAAIRTAQALRDLKYPGEVVVLSNESEWPYDRPPLSKNFLLGKSGEADVRLISTEKVTELGIDMRLSQTVSAIDRAARKLQLADGEELAYDHLVIATGATPIAIPALEGYRNASPLRSLNDARHVQALLGPGQKIALVGGGFIGLEIAAVATELGCEVTVIEASAAPLAPVLGLELGQIIQRWHEKKGIKFLCGSTLKSVSGFNGQLDELELESGDQVTADAVVVGVGTRANIEWLKDSGLELHRGLVCDSLGRSSDPFIFGVGDVVCCHRNGRCHPNRHWTATTEQARRVAKLICGETEQGEVIDDFYFWSDQHGVRMQFAGQVPQQPKISFAIGGPEEDKFVALCGNADEVTAVFSLGSPRDFNRLSGPLRLGEKVPMPA